MVISTGNPSRPFLKVPRPAHDYVAKDIDIISYENSHPKSASEYFLCQQIVCFKFVFEWVVSFTYS